MKKLSVLFVVMLISSTAFAQNGEDRHQSYISYDSGGTTVTQSFDAREIDGRVNLPIFSGDTIRTSRGGRAEIRLADGNVVALDGSSQLRFHAIFDSYEGAGDQTLIEVIYGESIVHRIADDGQPLRLDTPNATYVSDDFSLYSVESDGRGVDEVAVFGGAVEIRTRQGTTRMRAGERGRVFDSGRFDVNGLANSGMNDFERWYLRRADRYSGESSRYLDRRFAYADSDFDSYGSWVYVQDYGSWVWRPRVSIGWRPYFYGSWVTGPSGCLVWVSDEPWGWVPYHYGRWSYSPLYGWVWLPGRYYSPAWVYWAYGPSWVGWAPSGWYDCYRPYYPWLYRHYTPRFEVGFGFWGRIRVGGGDLHGWVVVDSNRVFSNRVDRAALTTDAIRHRLTRDGSEAAFTNTPARFTRDELRDPTGAVRTIARRGVGGTGTERAGTPADMTTFFRRDPDLSTNTRERLVRSVERDRNVARTPGRDAESGVVRERGVASPERGIVTRGAEQGSTVTRDRSTSTLPESRGRVVTRPSTERQGSGGTVSRPGTATSGTQSPQRVERPRTETARPEPDRQSTPGSESWRGSTVVPRDSGADSRSRAVARPAVPDSWKGTTVVGRESSSGSSESDRSGTVSRSTKPDEPASSSRGDWRSAPVPRRVIDSIGGSRVVTRDRGTTATSTSTSRDSARSSSGSSSSSSSSRSSAVTRPRNTSSSSGSVRAPSGSSSRSTPSASRPSSRSSSSSTRSSKPSSSKPSTSSSKSSSSSKSNRVQRSKPHGE